MQQLFPVMPAERDSTRRPHPARRLTVSGLIACILLAATTVSTAGGNLRDAQARYNRERAMCLNGMSNQDRATCLQEAGAALREAMTGHIDDTSAVERNRNNLSRCDLLPADEREYCVRRMRGEGLTSGSVAAGGIYRELVTPEVPR